jgi:uncharacterized protein YndB with AHSA1/START domain
VCRAGSSATLFGLTEKGQQLERSLRAISAIGRYLLASMNFATEEFRSLICAEPERVWNELTSTGRPLEWLYGMVVESTWQNGAAVKVAIDQRRILVGEVLAADRPHRLSFTLGDTLTDPSVFITWDLARDTDTTIIRLTVDETQPHRDAAREMELAWLPLILRLTALLDHPATKANEETKGCES